MPASSQFPLLLRLSRRVTPHQALIYSFSALVVLGWIFLMLPGFTTTHPAAGRAFHRHLRVCVTGLVVLDTGRDFTAAGQFVILMLIQLGGLGIMTFSIFFYRWWGATFRCGTNWRCGAAFPTCRTRMCTAGAAVVGLTCWSSGRRGPAFPALDWGLPPASAPGWRSSTPYPLSATPDFPCGPTA